MPAPNQPAKAEPTLPEPMKADGSEIFIVDDDPILADLLSQLFRSEGFRVTSFTDGGQFAAAAKRRTPACLIMDVFMPGRSGLDILKDINAESYRAPILIMTGRASIPMAVEAIRSGAFDILEKPFNAATLVQRVRELMAAWTARHHASRRTNVGLMEFPGIERLTQREREVLAEITAASSNKEAGRTLGLSPRTIEVHRAHIMMKLGAKNTADLVRLVLSSRPVN